MTHESNHRIVESSNFAPPKLSQSTLAGPQTLEQNSLVGTGDRGHSQRHGRVVPLEGARALLEVETKVGMGAATKLPYEVGI